jgi:hypothetical protein
MNLRLLAVLLLFAFGGGGFLFGGMLVGLGEVGTVLLVCLTFFLMGGFRLKA